MPTTTIGALPYPADSDAPDGPSAFQALAEAMAEYIPVTTYKSADESVTSSTVIQDDNELTVTLGVGRWNIALEVGVTGATGGDFLAVWSFSGSVSSSRRSCHGPGSSSTNTDDGSGRHTVKTLTTNVNYGTDGTSTAAVSERLHLVVDGAGTLKFRWAQNSSSGTATTVKAGSTLTRQKVWPA